MHRVAILAYDQLATFELACAIEIFSLPRPEYQDWYQTDVITFENHALEATGGINILAKKTNDLSAYDTLVVPGWGAENKHVRLDLAEQIVKFAALPW